MPRELHCQAHRLPNQCLPRTSHSCPAGAAAPQSPPSPCTRASDAHWAAWLLLADARPAPGISQSLMPSAEPHQPPQANPQNHLPSPPSSSSHLRGINALGQARGNMQHSRTCASWGCIFLLRGGMEEQRLQERAARSWRGSVCLWLNTAGGYSILTYSSSRRATPRLCYST